MPKPDSQETENHSLEELLSLKQHERPDDQFWDRFERELHAKPWQKMFTRQPWTRRAWKRLSETIHPAIPVGSAAAVAFAGFWGLTNLTLTAEQSAEPSAPMILADADAEPTPATTELVAEVAEPAMEAAEPQFVVGSFSSDGSADPAFTTVAATHYMPTSQRDGVHFAYNTIDSAAHASLAMATRPVRSIY